jgi:hypothetical protein
MKLSDKTHKKYFEVCRKPDGVPWHIGVLGAFGFPAFSALFVFF